MRKLLLIFLLLIIFIIPIKVSAADKSYTIDKLNITANITEKGDVQVQEEITYNFHGSYNGIYRNLSKNSTTGHVISQVSIKDKNNNITSLTSSNNSQNNTYQIIESNDNTQIKIFSKSTDETKIFIFNYTILAAATKHTDFAEFYWNFYKVENNIAVKDVNLKLALKDSKFDLNKFKYWTYVDGGEFNTNYDDNSIQLSGNNLTSLLGIKVHFQPEFLKISTSTYNNDNNQNVKNDTPNSNINNNMQNNSTIPNNYANIESHEQNYGASIVVIFVILLTSVGIFAYMDKKKKFQQALEKYRSEFDFFKEETLANAPSNLSPALVNLLYNEKYISKSAIPSTLFYLCKLGCYTLEKRKYQKSGFLRKDEVEDLCFIKNNNIVIPDSPNLKYFIKWFSFYEENGRFTLKSIEEEVSSRAGALKFKDCLSEWEQLIKDEAEKLSFYTTIEGKNVLNNKTYNERLKWLAYRQYLLEYFTNCKQDISLLDIDEALIYASALDIEEIHSEEFSKKLSGSSYEATDSYSYDMYNNYSFFLINLYMWDSINDNIYNNTIDNSNNNNNNGGGNDGGFGGFSGGGDFSGGGGGDSGAF